MDLLRSKDQFPCSKKSIKVLIIFHAVIPSIFDQLNPQFGFASSDEPGNLLTEAKLSQGLQLK